MNGTIRAGKAIPEILKSVEFSVIRVDPQKNDFCY